ncbi:MAG: hypothetical protein ABIP51_09540, partial [Bacteroidia bacterium]
LNIRKEIGDSNGIATCCINLCSIHFHLKDIKGARDFMENALKISLRLGNKDALVNCYGGLYKLDSASGNAEMAFVNFKKLTDIKDSLFNDENTKKQVKLEMNYEFEKKEAATQLEQEKKDLLAQAESKRQKIIIWTVCGILLLMITFAIFVYRSFLQKQKANIEIEKQKQVIEEKQKEILDSIHYAKRIQTALLTSEKYIDKNLKNLNK